MVLLSTDALDVPSLTAPGVVIVKHGNFGVLPRFIVCACVRACVCCILYHTFSLRTKFPRLDLYIPCQCVLLYLPEITRIKMINRSIIHQMLTLTI